MVAIQLLGILFDLTARMKVIFRCILPGKKIVKIAVDTFSPVVHIHIYVQRTGYVGGGKLRLLQLALGDAGGDAVL